MMIRTNKKLPQNGAVTHHHDQSITPVSFKPIKRTPSKLINPVPPEDDEDESLTLPPPDSPHSS